MEIIGHNMWWIKQLLSPLTYLRIRQGKGRFYYSKRFYDFGLPITLGILTSMICFSLPVEPVLLGDTGILNQVSGLLQLLVAFFIAALAAVATFDRKSMDQEMRGHPALLKRWDPQEEKESDKVLTRRQFVCHLFGYLAFSSLFLLFMIIVAKMVYPSLEKVIEFKFLECLEVFSIFSFWCIFWNIIISTVLGLYFLSDRMQHED